MKLKIGSYYTVLFTDGTTVSFRFQGGSPPVADVQGEEVELIKLLGKSILAYWEEDSGNPFVVG